MLYKLYVCFWAYTVLDITIFSHCGDMEIGRLTEDTKGFVGVFFQEFMVVLDLRSLPVDTQATLKPSRQ
jgi:hypothetical protein